jgi:hypothetical protein
MQNCGKLNSCLMITYELEWKLDMIEFTNEMRTNHF